MKRIVGAHKSVPSALWAAEITGRGLKSTRKLPAAHISKLDQQYNGMASMILELEDNFYKQEALKCRSCLFKISRRTCEATSPQYAENREWFIQCHGPELLVKILRTPPQLKQPQPPRATSYRNSLFSNGTNENEIVRMQRTQCMDILKELCFTNAEVADWLAVDESLLVFLFSLLNDKRTFDAAIGLIEEILAARAETFNLASVANFGDLVRGLSKGQLGLFCRILSMVIFEPDDKGGDEVVSSLELLNVRKQDPSRQSVRNIDRNHAVILGVPDLLSRLVKLLRITCAPNCRITDHIMAHTLRTAPDLNFTFPRRMDNEDDNNWDIEDDLSATSPDSNLTAALDPTTIEQLEELLEASDSAKHLARLTYQVELLFVIYALLAGKRRADLQDQLAKIGLIPTLSTLFDTIDWLKPPPPVPPNERMHGPNCECNPESTLKIQFLRLVLNFCDGDFENRSNKKLLLSDEEYTNLHRDTPVKSNKPPGLLVKLIQVFLKLPSEQPYRFWMSSCIEAFLRGSDASFQRFVAIQCGLLKYLVSDILSEDIKCTGSLQTGFDLLGELMKFNREIFGEFNKLLVQDAKFEKFITNVTTNLVDSNVFLRAMILSLERFREEDSKNLSGTPYPVEKCKIAKFLAESRVQLVMDLMTVISVEDINQENICCVNTALVLFIFSKRLSDLPFYLQQVKMTETNRSQPGSISKNFRKLLWFWNEYYAQRGRDCLSLEFSSQIKFSEWLSTYTSLVEELGEVEMPVLTNTTVKS